MKSLYKILYYICNQNEINMTAKDIKLIEKAKNDFWENIKPEEADTEEAREILEEILADGYHMEEAIYGMI